MNELKHQEIESLLKRLSNLLKPVSTNEETKETEEFIYHREYSIALDGIACWLFSNEKYITNEITRVIYELARIMEIDKDPEKEDDYEYVHKFMERFKI